MCKPAELQLKFESLYGAHGGNRQLFVTGLFYSTLATHYVDYVHMNTPSTVDAIRPSVLLLTSKAPVIDRAQKFSSF